MSQKLVQAAEEAINEVHADTSVPLETTLDDLRGLRDHIETLIDATECDIRRKQEVEDDGW